jgi:hypothetical protein
MMHMHGHIVNPQVVPWGRSPLIFFSEELADTITAEERWYTITTPFCLVII